MAHGQSGVFSALPTRWAWFVLLLVGCAHPRAAPADSAPTGSAPSSVNSGAALQSTRAHWVLHPEEKLRPTAARHLTDGALLEVDAGGLRWLTRPGAAPQASPFGAPESLVGLLLDGRDWAALGQSGTLYFFDEPLGPFTRMRSPPHAFVRTRVVDKSVLGINSLGQLFRSIDRGQTYSRVPGDAFFSDVGEQSGGDVYALAVPERWYRSVDGGAHFAVTRLPSVAPTADFEHENGVLLVQGLFGLVSPGAQAWAQVELPVQKAKPRGKLPTFARLQPLLSGSALLDDAGYVRVLANDHGDWQLQRGSMDQELAVTALSRPHDCDAFVLGGRSERPFLLCGAPAQDVSPELRLYRLAANSQRFEPLSLKLRGVHNQVQLRGSPDGQLAIAGVCAPHAAEPGCSPYGIVLVRGEKTSFLQLAGQVTLLDFGFDQAERLWALVQRQKDQHLLVTGPIVPLQIPPSFDVTLQAPQLMPDENGHAQLMLGQADLVTVIAQRWGGQHVAQLTSSGALLSVGRAPLGATSVHGTGKQLAAVDGRRQVYWESTSGGLVWSRQSLPVQVCDRDECEVALRCTRLGCMVGDELVRLGYQGVKAGESSAPHPTLQSGSNSLSAAALSCRPTEQAAQAFDGLWATPGVNEALLGDALWATVLGDETRGTASAVRVALSDLKIEQQVLFGPTQTSQTFKMGFYPQVEGSALLRYPVSPGSEDLEGPLEIAWDNRIEGVIGHATVHVGTDGPGAHVKLGMPVAAAMLSVAGRGLFVALGDPDAAGMYYLPFSPAAPPRRVADVVWPKLTQPGYRQDLLARLAEGARQEAVVAHGQERSLLLLANNHIVVQRLEDNTVRPYLMGGLTEMGGGTHQVHIAYRGKNVGFLSSQLSADGETMRAEFVEMGGGSPYLDPVSAALPRHLPARPQVCSAEQRATTPRVVESGASDHAPNVVVHGLSQEPLVLSVEDMVLFGGPQAPCLGVYGASARGDSRMDKDTALIVPQLNGGSFLFRTRGGASGQPVVTVQPMSCSFE